MLRGKRKKNFTRILLLLIPLAVAVFFVFRFITGLSILSVSSVQFSGPIAQSAARKISSDLIGSNILALSDERIKKEVTDNSNLSVQVVERKLPNTLVIKITANQAVLAWQSSKGRFLVDGAGSLYANASSEQIPQVSSPLTNESLGSKIDPHVTDLFQQLSRTLMILAAAIQSDGSIRVHLTTGTDVIFNDQGDIDSEIQALQLITAKAKIDGRLPQVVDLRFSKPVVSF